MARPASRPSARLRIGYQKNGVLLLAKSRGQFAQALPGVNIERSSSWGRDFAKDLDVFAS